MDLIKQYGYKNLGWVGKHSYSILIKELNLTIDNLKQSKKSSDIYINTSQYVCLNYDSGILYFTKHAGNETVKNIKFFDDKKKISFDFYYQQINAVSYVITNVKIKFYRQKYYDMLRETLKFIKK